LPGWKSTKALTCLAICKDAGVVTLEGVIEDVASQAVEDDLLTGELLGGRIHRIEAVIEGEAFWLLPVTSRK